MTELNELEKSVIAKLLEGDHPVLERLRRQLNHSVVQKRKFTGVGFFTEIQVKEKSDRVDKKKFQLGDVYAEITGLKHGAGFLMFIENGLLNMLEGFTYDENWPEDFHNFKLRYLTGDSRDEKRLREELETKDQS